jgi:Flp pilus assembly protein TadD
VIGLVQVGSQSMADRYTYIPFFGLLLMTVFGVSEMFGRLRLDRRIALGFGAVVTVILAAFSYVQAGYWHDNEKLYTRTIAVTRNNYLIEQNLCAHLITLGRLDEADQHCRASIESEPRYFPARNGLGMVEFGHKNYAQAEAEFAAAIELSPGFPGTYSNLALSQLAQGRPVDAEATLQKASTIADPRTSPGAFVPILRGLAAAFAARQEYQKAFENLSRLLSLTPDDMNARMSLSESMFRLGRLDEAQVQIETVLNAQPESPDAFNLLGMILQARGFKPEAVRAFETALILRPEFAAAKENLEKAKVAK